MNPSELIQDLLTHSYNSNLKYLNALQNKPLEEAQQWMCHILNAQHIWLSRINHEAAVFEIEQKHPMADLLKLNEDNFQKSLALLKSRDLNQKISYKNLKGLSFESAITEILTHVCNHATHHRGQISIMFKQAQIAVPATDLIAYYREKTPSL